MSTIYRDGLDLNGMVRDGPPVWLRPLEMHGIDDVLAVQQDYIFGPNASYPPALATGAANDVKWPEDNSFVLVGIDSYEPIGGGFVRARLTFAKVPGSHYVIESPYTYRYPGIIHWILYWKRFCDRRSDDIEDPNNPPDPPDNEDQRCEWRLVLEPFIYREPRSLTVPSRILHEYFLSATPPQPLEEQRWKRPAGALVVSPFGAVFLAGGAWADIYDEYLHTGAIANPSTDPTVAQYKTWVDNGVEFVAETSVVERWMGNIWVRKTRYVRAR